MATTAERILKLREEAAKATTLRANAEASVHLAAQQLAQGDEELKSLGVDPENCVQELAALEQQLDALVNKLTADVATEVQVYSSILDAAKQAGLR